MILIDRDKAVEAIAGISGYYQHGNMMYGPTAVAECREAIRALPPVGVTDEQVDAAARQFDPPAWSGRDRRGDHHRRTHSLKKARAALIAAMGV